MTENRLKRMINRTKERLKDLEGRKESLSKHGYWDIGYYKGRISVLEEWLDEINESNKDLRGSNNEKENCSN